VRASDAFPRRAGVERRALYFRDGGRLSFEPESRPAAADSFVSDPANPVPYRARPVQPTYGPRSRWYTWLLEDQRFVEHRPDVLSYATEPLADDLTISGDIRREPVRDHERARCGLDRQVDRRLSRDLRQRRPRR